MAEAATKQIEIQLGDGTVVKADTMDEAFKVVAKMKEDTAAALRAAKEESDRLRGEVETFRTTEAQRQAEAQRQRQTSLSGGFDKQHYYELLNSDPVAANDYYFQFRFGQKPEDFSAQYQRINNTVSTVEQQMVATAFTAKHAEDWPGDDSSKRLLRERVENLTNQGFPFNLDTLEYAYRDLIDRGSIKPLEPAKDEPPETANPSLGGSGSTSAQDDEMKKAENMSDKELEALLRSKGLMV